MKSLASLKTSLNSALGFRITPLRLWRGRSSGKSVRRYGRSPLVLLLMAVGCWQGEIRPAIAADRIVLDAQAIRAELSIEELTAFAQGQPAEGNFRRILDTLNAETQADLRRRLNTPLWQQLGLGDRLNANSAAHLLNEPMAQMLLQAAGRVIRPSPNENGAIAIQRTLLAGAEDPDGLTTLEAIQSFPSDQIYLNLVDLASSVANVSRQIAVSKALLNDIAAQSAREAAQSPNTLGIHNDLVRPGPYAVTRITLDLRDVQRDRPVPTNLFIPLSNFTSQSPRPVLMISHGLGSTREEFTKLAEFMASKGYAVAVPEHVGSNEARKQAFMEGNATDLFDVNEFVNRPRDLQFVLNALEQWQAGPNGQGLNLERVGVLGHSFGGYTALAVGGATLDFENLARDCQADQRRLNLSLLLQCRALELPRPADKTVYSFRDRRVAAVLVANPVSGSIFGSTGMATLETPVAILGGSLDFVTPVLWEQAYPFQFIPSEHKYFALFSGRSHQNDGGDLTLMANTIMPSFNDLVDPPLDVFADYARTVITAFAQAYVVGQPEFTRYLQPSFAQSISRPPNELFVLQTIESPTLDQAIELLQSTPPQSPR